MAEVYLATHQGIGGFRKLVVMKRLLGWQRGDDDAIGGLLDEARIAATINHPNIVTTLDIGLDHGSPYIVLEYLSGEDLRYLLQELHQSDASFPLGIAARIGASIASALSQAHALMLPDGSQRCIVHRDVTPSNIIVCYSGVTKLVDFGVARVSDDAHKTKSGIVKGKFSYLAPEQLTGAPLDGRTDVFQLGIVLWEMVTMRRLFEGKTDHERLNAVLHRTIRRPSELNPAVPTCLERTIMRALERNPARRHQTAQELEEELLESIAAIGGSGGDHSVAKWMQTAFADRQHWRQDLERRTTLEAADAAEEAEDAGEDVDDEVELQIETEAPESPWSRRRVQTGPARSDSGNIATGSSLRGIAVTAPVAPPRRSGGGYLVAALVVIGVAVWSLRSQIGGFGERARDAIVVTPPEARADYDVEIRVIPASASIAIDGQISAHGRYRASFADDGVVHTVTFAAGDHTTVQRRFQGATMLEVSLEPLSPPAAPVPMATATTATASDEPGPSPHERAGGRHDARQSRRERGGTRSGEPATSPAPAAGAEGTAGGSASPPARTKTPDDAFVPSSDNIDPFTTGN